MRINRSLTWIAVIALAITSLAITSPAEAQRRSAMQVGPKCVGGFQALFDEIEVVSLTTEQEEEMLFLRREEKLARDVYLTLADQWRLPIFGNLAEAEQRHIDLLLTFFEVYGITDTETDDDPGSFSDPAFKQLFFDLTTVNEPDPHVLADDLEVGAEIEDVGLAYLDGLITDTDNDHIRLIAHNLAKGSRNHLRAFVRALTAQIDTYVRQYLYFDPDAYLDDNTFDAILEAEMEQRMHYTAEGETVPACGGSVGGFG